MKAENSPGHGDTPSDSSRSLLELIGVEVQPAHADGQSGQGSVPGGWGRMPAGELAVRSERCADGVILWLSGELDGATAALLERELDAGQGRHPTRRIVDLTGLVLVDSAGLSTLADAQRRARDRGHPLVFRPGIGERRDELASSDGLSYQPGAGEGAVSDEHCYFALAMACATVDHQPPA